MKNHFGDVRDAVANLPTEISARMHGSHGERLSEGQEREKFGSFIRSKRQYGRAAKRESIPRALASRSSLA